MQVTVNVPPKWILQPKDSSVQSGEDISLHCQADGWPKPIVTWSEYTYLRRNWPFNFRSIDYWNVFYVCVCPRPALQFHTIGKAIGATPGEYKEFLYEPNVSLNSNGSLHFKKITKEAQGQYLCEAKNNIGAGVSKVIFLKVNGKKAFIISPMLFILSHIFSFGFWFVMLFLVLLLLFLIRSSKCMELSTCH